MANNNGSKPMGRLLEVQGLNSGEIAYNPAVIINKNTHKDESVRIIAARVESWNSYWLDPKHYDPRIMFFTQQGNVLIPIPDTPVFYKFEDPWATWLTGSSGIPQLLFGAVKVDFNSNTPIITTQLFLASCVEELDVNNPITKILNMKDVRVAQLQAGRIAVFTRPITGDSSPGRIGFTIINNIQDIESAVVDAPLLKFNLDKNARIGTSEAFAITKTESTGTVKELLNVFCHVATTDSIKHEGNDVYNFDTGQIHYAGYRFELNPDNPYEEVITLQKVADRSNFPINDKYSKGVRYDDVIFPGGTGGPGETEYFAGVEDARIGVIDISTFRENYEDKLKI